VAMTAVSTLTLWQSGTGLLHSTFDCSGLDQMKKYGADPADHFHQMDLTVLDALQQHGEKLCRLCALDPVISEVLRDELGPRQFVTFTLRRNPNSSVTRDRPRVRPFATDPAEESDRRIALREQMDQRLRQLAASAHLDVVQSRCGAAAYGFISRASVDLLVRAVWVETRMTVLDMPSPEVVATFWSLLASRTSHVPADEDPWFVAELICEKAT
jgi:hypothetical protein